MFENTALRLYPLHSWRKPAYHQIRYKCDFKGDRARIWQKNARLIYRVVHRWVEPHLATFRAAQQPKIWLLSIGAGIAGGLVAILFRSMIGWLQFLWIGTSSERILDRLSQLPWYFTMGGPIFGGCLIGLIIYFRPRSRYGGVADVIEARAHDGKKLSLKEALIGTSISLITLGFGGSAGREGPVVYFAASVSKALFRYFELPPLPDALCLAVGLQPRFLPALTRQSLGYCLPMR